MVLQRHQSHTQKHYHHDDYSHKDVTVRVNRSAAAAPAKGGGAAVAPASETLKKCVGSKGVAWDDEGEDEFVDSLRKNGAADANLPKVSREMERFQIAAAAAARKSPSCGLFRQAKAPP